MHFLIYTPGVHTCFIWKLFLVSRRIATSYTLLCLLASCYWFLPYYVYNFWLLQNLLIIYRVKHELLVPLYVHVIFQLLFHSNTYFFKFISSWTYEYHRKKVVVASWLSSGWIHRQSDLIRKRLSVFFFWAGEKIISLLYMWNMRISTSVREVPCGGG